MAKRTRKTIIAGNWKMNKTRRQARELTEAIISALSDQTELPIIVVCPPFTALQEVITAAQASAVKVGAQNMDHREKGAFTGEISPIMLSDLGVQYVIIGHSERRQLFGETNNSVNLKLKAALAHKLIPIVCVGETLDEREANLTDNVVSRQVAAFLSEIALENIEPLAVAYEPIWAIGTGKVCHAKEANRVCQLIRSTISDFYHGKASGQKGDDNIGEHVPVLYGGSVKPDNIDELIHEENIDGALVGGASLTAEEFVPLIEAARQRIKLLLSRV